MSRRFVERCGLAVVVLCLTSGAARALEALQVPRERIFSFDMLIDPEPTLAPPSSGAAGVAWRAEVRSRFPQGGDMDGIRLRVALDRPLAGGETVRVLDAAGRQVEVISAASTQRPAFWTREVPTGVAFVEFVRNAPGAAPGGRVTYAYHVVPTEKQSISGTRQLTPLADAPFRIKGLGRPVARLRFMVPGQGQATCTAFLVGARLMLTNEHCISTDEERDSALVDYDYDFAGSPTTGARVARIVATDPGLDYTLLELATEPPGGIGRTYFAPATFQWNAPPRLHPRFLVQHPSGEPRQVSMADCQLAGVDRVGVKKDDKSDFGHKCDTLGGSSGSPVMDWTTGLVVGLHHFGFLAGSPDPVNQAVAFRRVLADIAVKAPAAHAEMLLPKPN
jgi:hypothetical protein